MGLWIRRVVGSLRLGLVHKEPAGKKKLFRSYLAVALAASLLSISLAQVGVKPAQACLGEVRRISVSFDGYQANASSGFTSSNRWPGTGDTA